MKRHAASSAVLGLVLIALSCSNGDTAETRGFEAATSSPEAVAPGPEANMSQRSRPGEAVVLVHGWLGLPREFAPMKTFLDANGFRSFIAILPGEDNIKNAQYLQEFVTEVEGLTGVEKVNVVGFSMGGLSLRHYIRFLGGDSEVQRYVSIDTPQYGDASACLLPVEAGGQMCPLSSFLNDLNQGDDTPGSVSYTTIINEREGGDSGRLRGGATEMSVSGPHYELLATPSVHEAVLAALQH